MRIPRLTAERAFGPAIGIYAPSGDWSGPGVALAPQQGDPCAAAGINPNLPGGICYYPGGYVDLNSDCASCCYHGGTRWVSRGRPPIQVDCAAPAAAGAAAVPMPVSAAG
jgi:hypothetical protein